MSRYRLQRFCDPSFLGQIDPVLFATFLGQFKAFFDSRGVSLERSDHLMDELIHIFGNPPDDIPDDLVQSLYYLDEVSAPEYADHLAEVLASHLPKNLDPPVQDWSTVDIAIKLWLVDPEGVERIHAQQLLQNRNGLEYYVVRHRKIPAATPLNAGLEEAIALSLRLPLQTLQKGNAVQVFSFERGIDICFVVNFGTAYQRAFKIEDGETRAFGYRPVEHAVVYYSARDGEAAIRAKGVKVTKAVLQAIGHHLLGDKQVFVPAKFPAKFNLEPLRSVGRRALACASNDDIATACLTEIRWGFGGGLNHKENHSAADLFSVFEASDDSHKGIPHGARLKSATITFQQSLSGKPRKVRLMPPNRASYDREGDSEFIEPWLKSNGLINSQPMVIETGIESFWSAFEKMGTFSASKGEWKSRFNGCYHLAEPLLVDDDRMAELITLGSENDDTPDESYRVVTHGDGTMVAVDQATGTVTKSIKKSEAAAWRLDMRGLCERLTHTLGIEFAYEKSVHMGGMWQVGFDRPMEGIRTPVAMVKPVDRQSVHQAIDRLHAHESKHCILLLPTRRTYCGDVLERVRASKVTCMFLDEILFDANSDGFAFTDVWMSGLTEVRNITLPANQSTPATFPTPIDTVWGDVKIRFMDHGREIVSIKARGVTGVYSCEGMGLISRRNSKPTEPWKFLQLLAEEKTGIYSWTSGGANRNRQSHRNQLAKRFIEFFRIDDDPLPYDKAEGGWRRKFTLYDFDDPE